MPTTTDADRPGHVGMLTDSRFLAVLLVTFTGVFSNSAVPVALPGVSRSLAVPDAQIGLVMTAYFLSSAAMMLVAGTLADIYGRRTVVLPSLLLFGLASASIVFIDSFLELLVVRIVQGAMFPALTPLASALIGDLYEGPAGTTAQGFKSSANGLADLLSPAIAGVLAALSWRYPFLLGMIALPAAAVVYVYLPETAPNLDRRAGEALATKLRTHLGATRKELADTELRMLYAVAALGFAIRSGVITFVPLFAARELGATAVAVGLLFTARGVGRIPVAPLSGPLVARVSRRGALIAVFVVVGLAVVTFTAAPTLIVLGLLFVAYSLGDAMFTPVLNDAVVSIAAPERRSSAITVNSMFKTSANAISPAVLGLVLATGGFVPLFLILGGIAVLIVVVLFLWG